VLIKVSFNGFIISRVYDFVMEGSHITL